MVDNNKNRFKERKKSQAELRKMYPKDGADVGIINGVKNSSHPNSNDSSKDNSSSF
ncbi:hypothetical protein J2Z44_003935 [Clostridium punense]|uniref:Uncharacterized protein n=2 Tax=Clostridium TaxID=1485 RepID=A0ABS4K8H6_9CLOT|nr:hypothetical protein [Clostridium punense]EQB89221.1 hypothetical protein M918_21330 [Clostridium sp. BL8]MBP2024085.1 hypothetical protein [Clostridium punense]